MIITEDHLVDMAKECHAWVLTHEDQAAAYRANRAGYLRQLRQRGWTHERLAALIGTPDRMKMRTAASG